MSNPVINPDKTKPVIGVSSCLLGNKVRFDAGHKQNKYVTETLAAHFELRAFCPETGIGMSTPRSPIRLVHSNGKVRVKDVKDSSVDYTDQLKHYAEKQNDRIGTLSGFILKKDSPSCGMERVKLYQENKPDSPPQRMASGIFAEYLMQQFPELPLEEEGRLCDPVLRENFITRVYVYQRWQAIHTNDMRPADLINFHSDHKYLLMAHDQKDAVTLGRLASTAGIGNLDSLASEYFSLLMSVLKKRVSRGRHANVLQHIMGYLRDSLDGDDRQEMLATINNYRQGYVPLVVPITLLKHHFRKKPHPYIQRQHYLTPHPQELMLRNMI